MGTNEMTSKPLDRQVPLQAALDRCWKDLNIMMNIMFEESEGDAVPVYLENIDRTIIFVKGDARKGVLKTFDLENGK